MKRTAEECHKEYLTYSARHKELVEQQAEVEKKKIDNIQKLQKLEYDHDLAVKQNKKDEISYIRGEITEDEIKASRRKVSESDELVQESRRFHDLVDRALGDIHSELLQIIDKESSFKRMYCDNVKDDLTKEIDKDQNVRQKLIEAYSVASMTTHSEINWGSFLGSVFNGPTRDELKKCSANFRESHNL